MRKASKIDLERAILSTPVGRVDWASRRRDYDATTIDWKRLNAYAARVASTLADNSAETRWSLGQRSWSRKQRYPNGTEEEARATYSHFLTRSGELIQEVTSWTELIIPRVGWSEQDRSTFQTQFDDPCVMLFDFSRDYREFPGRVHVWTDRDPGRKLLVHAKGVGLSKALKALLP